MNKPVIFGKNGTLLAALLVLAVTPAAAVSLSTDGTGQVLLYPYYSTHAGQDTNIVLNNPTSAAKAIKLRVLAGHSGDQQFALNIYLGPFDSWNGVLIDLPGSSSMVPNVLSDDTSCTVPDLHAATLPTLADGRHYLPLPEDAEGPGVGDGEGYLVAIEMGELTGASAEAATVGRGPGEGDRPRNCAMLVAAWQEGGYWREDANTDIHAPAGGLTGSTQIIDVAEGTVFTAPATALKDFRSVALHTAPGQAHPDLGDAVSDPSTGIASAYVALGDNTIVRSDYPPSRAVDAVTAVLMTDALSADFDFRDSIAARSEFVISMPTKRFYVSDAAILPPFGRNEGYFVSDTGGYCPLINVFAHDRAGVAQLLYFGSAITSEGFPEQFFPKPCYATSVLALDQEHDIPVLHSSYTAHDQALTADPPLSEFYAQVGRVEFQLNTYPYECYDSEPGTFCGYGSFHVVSPEYIREHINIMRPDLAGRQYIGLPAIGFAATGYIRKAEGSGAALANYSFVENFDRETAVCVEDGEVRGCEQR